MLKRYLLRFHYGRTIGVAALLEALLDGDADALDGGTGLLGQLQQTQQGAAVGQEVVDDENMVLGGEELLGDDDIINFLVGEGLDLRLVVVVVQVDAHGLFGKHHRHVELTGHHSRDADAAGLDGEHLVDGFAVEQALPLLCHLAEQRDVHLMVDEAVHLEHVALTDDAVFADAVFQHFHSSSLPPNFPVTKRSIFHISIPDTFPVVLFSHQW